MEEIQTLCNRIIALETNLESSRSMVDQLREALTSAENRYKDPKIVHCNRYDTIIIHDDGAQLRIEADALWPDLVGVVERYSRVTEDDVEQLRMDNERLEAELADLRAERSSQG